VDKRVTDLQAGASFMIRYAHEMNGNWFVWGQQPSEYIASHQLVARILRNSTCGVAMVWAPNAASGGYPWTSAYADHTAM
jgi:beta-mannanase